MSGANVPRNLKYDQTDVSTLAETLIAKQAPEGRSSSFTELQKIDFRIPTSGGFVDSFASSTLNFDLDVTNASGSAQTTRLDPYLGAHSLISRIVVTCGGNIIEDTTQYPIVYKMMKGLHGNESRLQIDRPLSEDVAVQTTNNADGDKFSYWAITGQATGTTQRYRVRLNLLSCLGSLSGAKYWPSALMDSDIRLEVYLNSQKQGMIVAHDSVTWALNNVEFQLTRVRLNSRVIDALRSSAQSGGVKMIMPGFSHFQETIPATALNNTTAYNTKYSSSASSLKSILLCFRNQANVNALSANTFAMNDPLGLEYQFLIGSTLMPARPVNTSVDKYRELMRCMGGPINSLGQRNLITNSAYNTGINEVLTSDPGCHLIGQSLEMYADHTLSSTVFSGVNAINLTMQAHLRITGVATADRAATVDDFKTTKVVILNTADPPAPVDQTNVAKTLLVDSILVFDRLINFTGTEVTMGY